MAKKQRKDGKVLIDPKILAAGMAEQRQKQEEEMVDLGVPLVTGQGTAELGDGLLIDYNQESDRLHLRIGKESRSVTKLELWQFVFGISDPKLRDAIMPVRQVERVTYHRVHTVKLKNDMRAGQLLRVKCEMNVEQTVVEGLNGMIEQEKAKAHSGIIVPR